MHDHAKAASMGGMPTRKPSGVASLSEKPPSRLAEAEAFMSVARAVAGRVSVANGARAPAAAVPAAS